MKKRSGLDRALFPMLSLLISLLLAVPAAARDTKAMYSIAEALASPEAQSIDESIPLHFGDGEHPAIARTIGNFTSNKKTNGFGRSDVKACQRAFASAMLSFQKRARSEGGSAVVNLTSYYKENHVSSSTEFECGSGAVMSGVTFRGDVVLLD